LAFFIFFLRQPARLAKALKSAAPFGLFLWAAEVELFRQLNSEGSHYLLFSSDTMCFCAVQDKLEVNMNGLFSKHVGKHVE